MSDTVTSVEKHDTQSVVDQDDVGKLSAEESAQVSGVSVQVSGRAQSQGR